MKKSKRKFIEGGSYVCGIGTNSIERYEIGTYISYNTNKGLKNGYFSFTNGEHSNTELFYKYSSGCNAYRVITAKKIN